MQRTPTENAPRSNDLLPIRKNRTRRVWIGIGLTVVVLLLGTEVSIRYAGWVDFPVYVRDPRFGYFPAARQSGQFRNRNHWAFNDRGMGIAADFRPGQRTDILLVGNSVVSGGNAYDQPDKLTSRLQDRLGANCAVWPVAAGAWTTVNAVQFLQLNSDLAEKSDFFIWQFMTAQMDHANPWMSEARTPTSRPIWAAGYVLRKFLSERSGLFDARAGEQASDRGRNYDAFEATIRNLAARSQASPRGVILVVPTLEQWRLAREGQEWLQDRQRLERLAKLNDVLLVDLAQLPAWTQGMYWDYVHPTPFGNSVLASLLGDIVSSRAPFLNCDPTR